MSGSLKKNAHVTFGDAAMLRPDRINCTALLGVIIVEWSQAEAKLAQIYASLATGAMFPESPSRDYWVAVETFELLQNFKQKRDAIRFAATELGFDQGHISELDSRIGGLDVLREARHKMAHGRWGTSDSAPNAIVYARRVGTLADAAVFSAKDLGDIVRRFNPTMERIISYFAENFRPVI